VLVHYHLDKLVKIENPVVTIGSFDGVHTGHQQILKKTSDAAHIIKGKSILFTFYPHPRQVVHNSLQNYKLLTTPEEKIKLVEKFEIDHLILFPFTESFSKLNFSEFVSTYLVDLLQVQKVIIGYDYRFGNNREGDFEKLSVFAKQYGFEVEQIEPLLTDHVPVSSTKIREALTSGNIISANSYLGYHYSVKGKVVHGNKTGSKMGFPTANIRVGDIYKLIPANGVYAVKLLINDQLYKGMLNIGFRPTFNLNELSLEANIFDFEGDIYDKQITIIFYERIRDERKFPGMDELKNQLFIDKNRALEILS